MTTAPARPDQQSTNVAARRPLRLYVFAVTALAIFFVGLIIWRVPISSYVVTAWIEREADAAPGALKPRDDLPAANAASRLIAQLSDRRALREAVSFARTQVATPDSSTDRLLRNDQLDAVARRLEVEVGDSQPGPTSVTVRFASPDAEWAMAFVDRLSRYAVQAAGSASVRPLASSDALRHARWRLDETRHYQRRAVYDLQHFVSDHLEQMTGGTLESESRAATGSDQRLDKMVLPAGSHSTAVGQPAKPASDSAREQLERELVETRLRRTRLMRQYTENHPRVRDLTMQLADLEGKVSDLEDADAVPISEADNTTFPTRDAQPTGTGAATGETSPQVTARLHPEDVQKYLELRDAVERADADYDQAHRAFEDQLHLLTDANSSVQQPDEAQWIISPASITGHRGGSLPPARVLLIGLASLAGGAIMAWLSGSLRATIRVQSTNDLQAITRLPIVGQLSIDPSSSDAPRLATRQRVVRWGTLGCELTLGLLALTFIGAVMAGSPTFEQFADNPFGIFAETIVHVCRGRF